MATVVKKGRKTTKEKSFLHDEIITNILIRVPVKSVVRFGIVSKKWRDVTLARDFLHLHSKSSNPVILVSTSKRYSRIDLFAINKWWEFARNRVMTNRFPFYSQDFPCGSLFVLSHAGLIVLRGDTCVGSEFFILNPARPSNECVKITFCKELQSSNICAVYYHPCLKEYVSIWRIDRSVPFRDQPKLVQYKMLKLGSSPSLKMMSSSFNYTVKDYCYIYPVFINNYLYWKVDSEQEYKYSGRNDILEFDILSEEFMVIPCPVPLNTECLYHQTHLLNSDGILVFLLMFPSTITIWKLDDHVQQLWTTTKYTLSLEICDSFQAVGIIALADGMLAFKYESRLFICNLKEGTVKNNPKRKYSYDTWFFSHQTSLASLKNCKSALYIEKDGELLL